MPFLHRNAKGKHLNVDPQPSKMYMDNQCGSELLRLAEHHAKTVARLETAKQNQVVGKDTPDSLAQAIADEAELRISLIRCQPSSIHEAQTKLLYLVHYLAKTRSSFDTSTMLELENSIAHLIP